MLKNLDTRDFGFYTEASDRLEALNATAEALSGNLPGDQAFVISRLNTLTGTPQQVRAIHPGPTSGSLIDQALDLVRHTEAVLGFAETTTVSKVEFVPDPKVQTTSSGTSIVHLQQVYHGIPVFGMARSVTFSSDQLPQAIVGDNVSFAEEPDLIPAIDVKAAMQRANEYINANQITKTTDGWGVTRTRRRINTSRYMPKELVTFAQPSRPTVLDKGVFQHPIPAHLVLFPQGPTTLLGWHFIISLPRNRGQYRIIVSADMAQPGDILYVEELTHTIQGMGKVHPYNGDDPRQSIAFPRPLTDYPVPAPARMPPGFPPEWIETRTSATDTFGVTAGNNVLAGRIDGTGIKMSAVKVVNNSADFDPPTTPDQYVLNAFYYVNFLHDFFYLLGFDEASGNFQETNPTGHGYGTDRVVIAVFDDPVDGTASMDTQVDSLNPLLKLGLYARTNRHTALDADVVFHEFVHGVTNRLVGGPLNTWGLAAPQSRGMGEGWSDYFALSILNRMRNQNKTIVADWLTNQSGGLRSHPYDESYPGHFGKLGDAGDIYVGNSPHNLGEIWCATLTAMTRRVINILGEARGYPLCWQIVLDGLKLTPVLPSFLDARDAILHGLDDIGGLSATEHEQVLRATWGAFAKFGMGPNARSLGPGILRDGQGIVADFNLPPGV